MEECPDAAEQVRAADFNQSCSNDTMEEVTHYMSIETDCAFLNADALDGHGYPSSLLQTVQNRRAELRCPTAEGQTWEDGTPIDPAERETS